MSSARETILTALADLLSTVPHIPVLCPSASRLQVQSSSAQYGRGFNSPVQQVGRCL